VAVRSRGRAITLVILAVTVALTMALAVTPSARAHAVVNQLTPSDQQRLNRSPVRAEIRFSEPVQLLRPEDMTVVDATGTPVTAGGGRVLPGDASVTEVPIRPGLQDGTYTVRWRVVSSDGHIIPGASVFAVGDVPITPPYLGGPGGGSGPTETSAWAVTARWIELVGIGGLLALLIFRVLVWRDAWRPPPGMPEAERDSALAWGRDAWWIGFGTLALVALIGEAMVLVVKTAGSLGTSAWGALADPAGIVRVLADTRFGDLLQIRTLALFVLFALGVWRFLVEYRSDRAPDPRDADGGLWPALAMLVPALVALGSISAQGHASTTAMPRLQIPVDALHAAAASAWVGGLAIVGVFLLRLPRVSGRGGRLVGGIVLARFSALALLAVAILVASGVIRAVGQMSSPTDLWETPYGWTILVKVGLLAIAGVFALRSRRIVSALRRTQGPPNTATLAIVRRNAWITTGITLVVVSLSALLVGQVPPLS
jgi:copper transport protein